MNRYSLFVVTSSADMENREMFTEVCTRLEATARDNRFPI
jgi:hypothetical protein